MAKLTATFHEKPRHRAHRDRGARIRVGTGGAHDGAGYTVAGWMTVAEAEAFAAELARAIARARLAETTHPPRPPTATSAALPAA